MRYFLSNLVFLFIISLTSCGGSDSSSVCPDHTCAEFTTQEAAQAVFDNDKDCSGELDTDNDGIACEHLSSSGSGSGGGSGSGSGGGCPTTGNCGCSGKKKAECGGSCCAWIVGTGCKCK